MKRVAAILTIAVMLSSLTVFGAYRVETDDDEYVSDEVYFAPVSTWDEVKARSINLKKGRLIFYAGKENEPQQIEAAVMPVNTTRKELTYKSNDISVARVDGNGLVTPAGKAGETTIDIICGRAKAIMKVSVVKGVEGVTMSQDALTLYADKPVTAQLSVNFTPADATIKDVKWHSSDESVAYVDKNGLVSPNGVGSADIYAETVDGGFTAKCAVTVSTWEKRSSDIPIDYEDYDITTEELIEAQLTASPTVFTDDAMSADRYSVEQYANPENLTVGYDKYQFIDLGLANGVSAETLDAYLNGKGALSGMGGAFKDAAERNNISEVYLVIHACLETGSGTSALANGIDYGEETVYNMFGIGASDTAPEEDGARFAYEQGWTSVREAIYGGAEWISENYINNSHYNQNTLYKMRWNPSAPATHQYATDVAWASKQARSMGAMFEAFPSAKYRFKVPVFSGRERLKLR